MSPQGAILVATDVVADGELVRNALGKEFDRVYVTTVAERAADDFEEHKPSVLVLAFDTLERCQSFCLHLYRHSTKIHAMPHRSVVLCSKGELHRAYELCKKGHFDDYVLFWPMTHDAPRLPMVVHQKLGQMEDQANGPSTGEWFPPARRLGSLQTVLDRNVQQGGERVAAAMDSVEDATRQIAESLKQLSARLAASDSLDAPKLAQELDRLESGEIAPGLQSITTAVARVQQWVDTLKKEFGPLLDSARALQTAAAKVRPSVIAVEDDDFQRSLLKRTLDEAGIDVTFATSGVEALGVLRKCRPDLILMDMNLPDIDGVEVTRRLKSCSEYAKIPVIMVTGDSEREKVVSSVSAGAVDFVVKPFDKSTLLTKVRKLLYDGAIAAD